MGENRATGMGGGGGIYCGVTGNGWQYETSNSFVDPTVDSMLGIVQAVDADFGTTSAAAVVWTITQTAGPSRTPTITARGSTILEGFDFNITPGSEGDYTGCEFSIGATVSSVSACNALIIYCDVAWQYNTVDSLQVNPGTGVGSLIFLPGPSVVDLEAIDPTISSPGNAGNVNFTVTQTEGIARTVSVAPVTGDLVDGFYIFFDGPTYGGFAMTSFSLQADIGGTPVRPPILFHCLPFLASGTAWTITGLTSTTASLVPDAADDFGNLTVFDFQWVIIPAGSGETLASDPVPVDPGDIYAGFIATKTGPNALDAVTIQANVFGRPAYGLMNLSI